MIYLVDTDVGITLSECNCIQHLPVSLDCCWDDIFFDSELRQLVGRLSRSTVRISAGGQQRLRNLSRTCRMINDADVNDDEFELAFNAGANDGECELLAAMGSFYPKDVTVITGDHRALRDVHTALPSGEFRDRVMGRVMCLEQLLCLIARKVGYDTIEADLVAGAGRLNFLNPHFTVVPLEAERYFATLEARIESLSTRCPRMLVA